MQALRVSRSTLRIEGILLYGAHLMQHLPILHTLHDITALRKVNDLDGKKRCITIKQPANTNTMTKHQHCIKRKESCLNGNVPSNSITQKIFRLLY